MAILSNNASVGLLGAGVSASHQIAKSLRLDGGDDAHLNRTFASGGSTTTWTLSFWIKGHDMASACYVFTGGTGTSSHIDMDVGQFRFYSNNHDLKSNALYKDPTAWYHFVVVADTTNGTDNDKTRVYVNGTRLAVGDFATHTQPSASAALGDFNSAAAHYFNRLTTGNQQDMMLAEVHFVDAAAKEASDFGEFHSTTGQWVPKKYAGTYGTTGFYLKFDGTDLGEDSAGSNDWTANNLTQSINTGQPKMYKSTTLYTTKADIVNNGTEVSGGDSVASNYLYIVTNGASGSDTKVFSSGWNFTVTPRHWSYDGSSWVNKASYGANEWDSPGIFWSSNSEAYKYFNEDTEFRILCDPDTSSGPAVFSSGTNTAPTLTTSVAEQSINSIDVSIDTPTPFDDGGNGTGNYCTLNPLAKNGVLSQGNLYITGTSEGNAKSTMGFTSGKWYAEVKFADVASGALHPALGFATNHEPFTNWAHIWPTIHMAYNSGGPNTGSMIMYHGGGSGTTYASNYFDGKDTFQMALDMDNGKGYIGDGTTWYNSTWNTSGSAGNPATGANPTFTLDTSKTYYFWIYANGTNMDAEANFGQRPYKHTPPSGFKACNTYNLPDPTIAKPTAHVNSVLYTGTGSSQTISGVGFQPDLTWTVRRNGANANYLFNSVAGVSEVLYPTHDVGADAFSDFAFTSDGFTADGTEGGFNANTNTFVAWNWLAASANVTDSSTGSITSTYRANTDAGFSIVKYTGNSTTGATISHGLNATPDFAMFKSKTDAEHWNIYHKDMGNTHYLQFDTGDKEDDATAWNDTNPTTTVMTLGNKGAVNRNTAEIRAFLWSEVDGYSKFGSYEGNGDADGPFVYCGFRPAILWLKNIDDGGNWVFLDNKRLGYNPDNNSQLIPVAGAENTVDEVDFLASGFKLRTSLGWRNADDKTHIFAAWAESPFKYSNAR